MKTFILSIMIIQITHSQYKNIFTGATTLEEQKDSPQDDYDDLFQSSNKKQTQRNSTQRQQNTSYRPQQDNQSYDYLFEDDSSLFSSYDRQRSSNRNTQSYQQNNFDDFDDSNLEQKAVDETEKNLQRLILASMGIDTTQQSQQGNQNQLLQSLLGQNNSGNFNNLLGQMTNSQNSQLINQLNSNALQNQQFQNQQNQFQNQNGNLQNNLLSLLQPQQQNQNLLQQNTNQGLSNQNTNQLNLNSQFQNLLGQNQNNQFQNLQSQNNSTAQIQPNNNINSLLQLLQNPQQNNLNQFNNTNQQNPLQFNNQQQLTYNNQQPGQQNNIWNNGMNLWNQLNGNNTQNTNQFSQPTQTLNPANCVCPQTLSIVCGSNGKTYTNQCFAQCEGIQVVKQGTCLLQGSPSSNINQIIIRESNQQVLGLTQNCAKCSQKIEPVCGVNNKLYKNRCLLQCEGIAMKKIGKC